jgi:hypothetical protein
VATEYVVKQGDHLSKIAREWGFADYQTIWNHPNNAELKQKRKNPHVLYPGDTLFIPDLGTREEACDTEQRHTFVAQQSPLMLRLVLEDVYENPVANAKCDLIIDADQHQMTTDNHGRIEKAISPTAHDSVLMVRDSQTPNQNLALQVKIGDLDPVEEISGQQARLHNLGYYTGAVSGVDERRMRLAIEEFQCEHGLLVDGICGPKTQAKLKEVHGS